MPAEETQAVVRYRIPAGSLILRLSTVEVAQEHPFGDEQRMMPSIARWQDFHLVVLR